MFSDANRDPVPAAPAARVPASPAGAPPARLPRSVQRRRRAATFDLRRAQSAELAGRMAWAAEHFAPEDREIALLLFRDGLSASRIAAVRARGEKPRAIRRRARRLLERITRPEFLIVARDGSSWSPLQRRIAETVILRGRSLRSAAKELGVGVHIVRRHIDAIRVLARESAGARPRTAA